MKTILVTGAGGYIGCVLIPKLLGIGYKVKAVFRHFFGLDKLPQHDNLIMIKEDTRRLKAEVFANVVNGMALGAWKNGVIPQDGHISATEQTITLGWYKELIKRHRIIGDVRLYGGIMDLEGLNVR